MPSLTRVAALGALLLAGCAGQGQPVRGAGEVIFVPAIGRYAQSESQSTAPRPAPPPR